MPATPVVWKNMSCLHTIWDVITKWMTYDGSFETLIFLLGDIVKN